MYMPNSNEIPKSNKHLEIPKDSKVCLLNTLQKEFYDNEKPTGSLQF